MQRTQVLFTPSLKSQVDGVANTLEISFSEAVRRLVAIGLHSKFKSGEKKNNPAVGLLKLAEKSSAWSTKNAPKDLASNDEYLYGKKSS